MCRRSGQGSPDPEGRGVNVRGRLPAPPDPLDAGRTAPGQRRRGEKFLETVINGRKGSRGTMPPFGYVLSPDEVWQVHAFVMARDGL